MRPRWCDFRLSNTAQRCYCSSMHLVARLILFSSRWLGLSRMISVKGVLALGQCTLIQRPAGRPPQLPQDSAIEKYEKKIGSKVYGQQHRALGFSKDSVLEKQTSCTFVVFWTILVYVHLFDFCWRKMTYHHARFIHILCMFPPQDPERKKENELYM